MPTLVGGTGCPPTRRFTALPAEMCGSGQSEPCSTNSKTGLSCLPGSDRRPGPALAVDCQEVGAVQHPRCGPQCAVHGQRLTACAHGRGDAPAHQELLAASSGLPSQARTDSAYDPARRSGRGCRFGCRNDRSGGNRENA